MALMNDAVFRFLFPLLFSRVSIVVLFSFGFRTLVEGKKDRQQGRGDFKDWMSKEKPFFGS